jgi:hypothetical protein
MRREQMRRQSRCDPPRLGTLRPSERSSTPLSARAGPTSATSSPSRCSPPGLGSARGRSPAAEGAAGGCQRARWHCRLHGRSSRGWGDVPALRPSRLRRSRGWPHSPRRGSRRAESCGLPRGVPFRPRAERAGDRCVHGGRLPPRRFRPHLRLPGHPRARAAARQTTVGTLAAGHRPANRGRHSSAEAVNPLGEVDRARSRGTGRGSRTRAGSRPARPPPPDRRPEPRLNRTRLQARAATSRGRARRNGMNEAE